MEYLINLHFILSHMKYFFWALSLITTVALCILLDGKYIAKVRLGRLLSPQEGLWQNAEPVSKDYSQDLKFTQLKIGRAHV